jgi:hypothetical protein
VNRVQQSDDLKPLLLRNVGLIALRRGQALRAWPTVQQEPIQQVVIHEQDVDLVKRLSMILIMAHRVNATTVLA